MIAGYSDRARPLTPRMRDVLACSARGLTTAETARELNLSVSTVWNERAALCARLHAPNMYAALYRYGRGEA